MYDPIFDTEAGTAILKRIVAHYSDVFLPCEEKDRAYYRGLKKKEAARSAGRLLRHDGEPHDHAENWVEGSKNEDSKEDRKARREMSLRAFADALVEHRKRLRKGMTFGEIHMVVEEAAGAVSKDRSHKVRLFKPSDLLRYDAALFLAWHLDGEPEGVWLHSGADWGYRSLGGRRKKFAPLNELPEPLRELPAWQVEDILCIYRLVFYRLVSGKDADEALFTDIAHKRPTMGCKHRRCTTAC